MSPENTNDLKVEQILASISAAKGPPSFDKTEKEKVPAKVDIPEKMPEKQEAAFPQGNAVPETENDVVPVAEKPDAAVEKVEGSEEKKQKPPLKIRIRRILPVFLTTLLYVVLLFLMFTNVSEAARPGVAVSARYDTPVPVNTVANAVHMAGNPNEVQAFSAAYWSDVSSRTFTAGRGEVETPVLFVDGDISTVYKTRFLYGAYPSVLEKNSIAVSTELAWKMFGGVNVIGAETKLEEKVYTVSGVFEGDELLMLAQVEAKNAPVEGFRGVELTGVTQDEPKQEAQQYLSQLNLPEPDNIFSVQMLPGIMNIMAWLPLSFLAVWLLVQLFKMIRKTNYWLRMAVYFVFLVGIALLLPRLMAMLPGWIIPAKWSDFDHWSVLFKEVNGRFSAWLGMTPFWGDIQAKRQLILQTLLFIPALITALSMLRRWSGYMGRKEAEENTVPVQDFKDNKEKEGQQAEQHDDIHILKSAAEPLPPPRNR